MSTLALTTGTVSTFTSMSPVDQAVIGLLSRCKTLNTRREYTRDIKQFLTWCHREGVDPLTARRPQIELYVRQLQADPRGYAEATINRRVGTMRLFYLYATMDELIDRDPSLAVQRPQVDWRKQHRTHLTAVDFAAFLLAAKRESETCHAIMMLMGLAGLRVGEVCSLNIEHMTIDGGYETIRFIGKGNKAAVMRLEPPVARAVRTAIGHRVEGPMFLNHASNRITRSCVHRLVTKTAKAANVRDDISPHSLRRTCATTLIDLGESLYEVQNLLRHEDPKTTQRYDQKMGTRGGAAGGRIASFITTLAS